MIFMQIRKEIICTFHIVDIYCKKELFVVYMTVLSFFFLIYDNIIFESGRTYLYKS